MDELKVVDVLKRCLSFLRGTAITTDVFAATSALTSDIDRLLTAHENAVYQAAAKELMSKMHHSIIRQEDERIVVAWLKDHDKQIRKGD